MLAAVEPGIVLEYAWLIPVIMAASFALILFFGKRLPKKGSEVGVACIGACFLFAVVANVQWFQYVNDSEHAATETHEVEDDSEGHEEGIAPVAVDGHALAVAPAEGESATPAVAAQEEELEDEGTGGEAEGHEEFEVEPVVKSVTWFQSGGVDFQVGMLLDGMAVMMLFVVTLISLLVHVFSTDYVGGDRRYTHYFAFLSLFSAAMLGFVMSLSTVQLITMWELVGVCSFVLIGHWWEEKPNSDAALKAFLTNRVGDVGLLVGMITLYFAAGQTFDIIEINTLANEGGISHTALLVASCCLVAAVMSKSGQFILHTWLPDAMAGPTPVSALIHAATMVVAGIYMVGRMYGVFWNGLSIGTSNVNLLAVVGGVTVIGGAGLAFVQADIKKVLAYSTVSQLGYMVMALGVGAWTAAMFHLFTHAFFKAGLFLGSGSVAHAVHSFDMKKDMGGMKQFMPRTWLTFVICTISLIGIFPMAGFWSKDEILAGASQLGSGYTAFMVVGLIGAFMTAAYMTRCVYLTFYGEYRGAHHLPTHDADADADLAGDDIHALEDEAHAGHAAQDDPAHDAAHHGDPHESGPWILVPLYILASLAVVAGFVNIPDTDVPIVEQLGAIFGTLHFEHFYEPKAPYFPSVLTDFAHPVFSWGIALTAGALGLLGIGLAGAWYFRGLGPHRITERSKVARAGYTVLANKYYFDHLYTGIIANGVKGPIARAAYWFNQKVIDGIVNAVGIGSARVGTALYEQFDQKVVDGVVNGSGFAAEGGGQIFRQMQTGKVQQYAAILFAGAVVLAGVFIVVI